jgi:hypothetical protein
MSNADDKIKMLKSSFKCFVFGLLGFLPVLGFGFAVAALRISGKVRGTERNFWNAARPYRIWGVVCAALSVIFWSFILILVVFRMMNPTSYND